MGTAAAPPLRARPLVRAFAGAFLVLHGVAHLVGTQVAFAAYADGEGVPYLLGAWEVRGAFLIVVGALWVVAALGFAAAAWKVAARRDTRRGVLGLAASVSLVLSMLALPQAWIGVVINVGLLGVVWLWVERDPAG